MEQALATCLEDLNRSTLPALKQSRDALVTLLQDENVTLARVVEIIEGDPGLAVRLLRHINGLSHKHLKTEITTVAHGQMMLGLTQLRSLPKNMPVVEELDAKDAQRLLEHYSRAYHAAYQARELARHRADMEPDEIFLAALVHNLSDMLLSLRAPDKMREIAQLTANGQEPEEAQQVVLGFDVDALTAALAEQWGLPNLVTASLHAENASNPRILGIMLANQLARDAERGWQREETLAIIEAIADYLMINVDSAVTMVHQNAVEAARQSGHFGVHHAAANLVLSCYPQESAAAKPAVKDTQPSRRKACFCLAPNLPLARRNLKKMVNDSDQSTISLDSVLQLATEAMHVGLGLNRVVFCLLSRDKTQLRARSVLGADNDPHFSRFNIDLYRSKLFRLMIEKPQSLWFNAQNRDKFGPLLPAEFFEMTGNDSFFAMSVVARGKPVGLFYADRHSEQCQLDERSYKYFKSVVNQTAQSLTALRRKR